MKHILLILISVLYFQFSFGQSGSFDPTFNTIDNCTYGNGDGFDKLVNSVVLQPDGKTIAVGDFTTYNGKLCNRIVRINTDGTLDNSFQSGSGFNGFYTSYGFTSAQTVALQQDGKILVGGIFYTYNGSSCRGIVRLNSNGTIDKSFNVSSGFDAPVFKILVQSDGKVIAGGAFTTYIGISKNRIIRLNTNGSIDTSFKIGTGFNNYVRTLTLTNSGKILAGGMFNSFNGTSTVRIARLKQDGTFDAAFATGSGFQNEVTTIITLPNGKLIIAGHFGNYKGTFITRIVKIDSSGTIDNSFSVGAGFDAGVYTASLQSDGKIVVGGLFTKYNNVSISRICRLKTDGTLDTSFGTKTDYANGEMVLSTAIQSNGKIIIAGDIQNIHYKNAINHLDRLETNGRFDVDYNHGTGFTVAEVSDFKIQSDNKILACGTFFAYNGYASNAIVRLKPNGEIDSSFVSRATVSSNIITMSLQNDGKIIIGGAFGEYNKRSISCIGRLHSDGNLDTTFKVGKGANGYVYSTAIQNDGKILVGGGFSKYNDTTTNNIVRLNPNGSIDTSFKIGIGFDAMVFNVTIQPDNKILVAGRFLKYNGIAYGGIIRLLPNGAIDTTFKVISGIKNAYPSTGGIAFIYSMTLQNDGKIIATGNFTSYNGISRVGIVRIDSLGGIDASFSTGPGFDKFPYKSIIQSDGKILVTGNFTSYRTTSRNGIVRLKSDGFNDVSFTVGSGFNTYTKAISFHSGERILVGGDFTTFDGYCRTRIARLLNCESLSKDVVKSCGPIQWKDGKTYSASNSNSYYAISNGNINNCDSFILLNLTVNSSKESTQNILACNSYTWRNGITYNSSINTPKDTIIGGAANGCDSIITLNLTILKPTYYNDFVMACRSYKWINGTTYTSSNNTAKYTIFGGAYNGCDSIISLNLTIINLDMNVAKNLNLLSSNEVFARYQWIDCNNQNQALPNDTLRLFEPDKSGSYAVIVTKDGCTDTSDCIEVTVENNSIKALSTCNIQLHPNPNNGSFKIENMSDCSLHQLIIKDCMGRTLNTISAKESDSYYDLGLPSGIYFIELDLGTGNSVHKKIVVNH